MYGTLTVVEVQLFSMSRDSHGLKHHVASAALPLFVVLCDAKGNLEGSVKSQCCNIGQRDIVSYHKGDFTGQ